MIIAQYYLWKMGGTGTQGHLDAWCLHPNFKSEMKSSWENNQISGWASFMIMKKLGNLRVHLKRWNCQVFGNIDDQLKKTGGKLHEWEIEAEGRNL